MQTHLSGLQTLAAAIRRDSIAASAEGRVVILHLDCSPRPESFSRQMSREILEMIMAVTRGAIVSRRDLTAMPLPHVTTEYANGLSSRAAPPAGSLDLSDALIEEVEAAAAIVIGTPMHNLTVPSALKAWIDQIMRLGRTFESTPAGKKGLLADRPVFVAVASGLTFLGEQAVQPDFLTPYLSAIFNSIGLKTIQFFPLQATALLNQDTAVAAKAAALASIDLTVMKNARGPAA